MAKAMTLDVPKSTESAPAIPNGTNSAGRPYCGRHNCLMVARSTQGQVTYYGCQVAGCGETEKRVKDGVVVSAKPHVCGNRTCDGAAREVDPLFTGSQLLRMVCPKCGDVQMVPRPAMPRRAAAHIEPLGFDER